MTLDRFALAIFVSVNSVHALAKTLTDSVRFPAQLAVAAIGQATADALERLGISVRFLPEGSHDSEGLLRALSKMPVEGRNVVIYRGDDGRNVLASGLSQRGAHVYPLESYRRHSSPSPLQESLVKWLDQPKGILLVTSVFILKSLLSRTPVKWQSQLVTRPVVTMSARIASACRAAGFHGLIQVTDGTDCKAITKALVTISQRLASRDINGRIPDE